MSSALREFRLGEMATLVGGKLQGGGEELIIRGAAGLDTAGPAEIAFYSKLAYRPLLASSKAGAIVVSPRDAALPELSERPLLVSEQPYAAFAQISAALHPAPELEAGIHPLAQVEEGATVDPAARVEAFAVVRAGAKVAAGAAVGSGAYVGAEAVIGEGSILFPRSVVLDRCVIGARCVLHPGAVVGTDGFGFAFDPQGENGPVHRAVPQLGIARLQDEVVLGANTCVDRATFGETVIGRGSKLDNLVQIGHNVKVGPLSVFAAQVGIAGSTTVGTGVAMGGQAGIAGHIHIGDRAQVAAASGVAQDVEPGTTIGGYPATPIRRWLKSSAALTRLPALLLDFKALLKRVESLEESLAKSSDEPSVKRTD